MLPFLFLLMENGIRVYASEAEAKSLVGLSRWVRKRGDGVI
jgi:hypothetical protein